MLNQFKNPAREDFIQKKYQDIMKRIDGSTFYGELIDKENIRELVFFAYLLGTSSKNETYYWTEPENHYHKQI